MQNRMIILKLDSTNTAHGSKQRNLTAVTLSFSVTSKADNSQVTGLMQIQRREKKQTFHQL